MSDLTALVGYLDATTIMSGELDPPFAEPVEIYLAQLYNITTNPPIVVYTDYDYLWGLRIRGQSGGVGDQTETGYAIPITVHGKNLLQLRNRTRTQKGITFTPNEDGSVTVNGTATDTSRYVLTFDEDYIHPANGDALPAGTYTASYSGDTDASGIGCFYGVYESGGSIRYGKGTFTIADGDKVALQIQVNSGTVCNNVKVYPQLEAGSTATDYEPYFSNAVTVTVDSPLVAGQSVYIPHTTMHIPTMPEADNYIEFDTTVKPRVDIIYRVD